MIVLFLLYFLQVCLATQAPINRRAVVSRFNPTRNAASLNPSPVTPMQIGNGNFAFGTDITGLQTFQPFAIMSSWGWKNDSFPAGVTMPDILNWNGTDLDTHGRMVQYGFSPATDNVGNWLISNPNRVNLGRISLLFLTSSGTPQDNLSFSSLSNPSQSLDLFTGIITSTFTFQNTPVKVTTACSHASDTVSVQIQSDLIRDGRLAVFLDFPWNDGSMKFEDPFVGSFNASLANLHTTTITKQSRSAAEVAHTLGASTFFTSLAWEGTASFTRDSPLLHRYTLKPSSGKQSTNTLTFTVTYGLESQQSGALPSVSAVLNSSTSWWETFWNTGGFVDLTGTNTPEAIELQRRIILSQYLLAVNEAGDFPPEE
ncbi:hypothetical protein M422DRAFT_177614, partial [Sphaerobolus stellatus SS14]